MSKFLVYISVGIAVLAFVIFLLNPLDFGSGLLETSFVQPHGHDIAVAPHVDHAGSLSTEDHGPAVRRIKVRDDITCESQSHKISNSVSKLAAGKKYTSKKKYTCSIPYSDSDGMYKVDATYGELQKLNENIGTILWHQGYNCNNHFPYAPDSNSRAKTILGQDGQSKSHQVASWLQCLYSPSFPYVIPDLRNLVSFSSSGEPTDDEKFGKFFELHAKKVMRICEKVGDGSQAEVFRVRMDDTDDCKTTQDTDLALKLHWRSPQHEAAEKNKDYAAAFSKDVVAPLVATQKVQLVQFPIPDSDKGDTTTKNVILTNRQEKQDGESVYLKDSVQKASIAVPIMFRRGSRVSQEVVDDAISNTGFFPLDKFDNIYFELPQSVRSWCLNHPSNNAICKFMGDAHLYPVIVTKLFDSDLFEYDKKKMSTEPSSDMFFDLARQMLQAVDAIHKQGWSHRDIKMENILIKNTGSGKMSFSLADFGMSIHDSELITLENVHTRDDEQKYKNQHKTATPLVWAPEVMAPGHKSGNVDKRRDLYACGIVLHEFLTRQGWLPPGDWIFTDFQLSVKDHRQFLLSQVKVLKSVTERLVTAGLWTAQQKALVERLIQGLLKQNPDDRFSAQQALAVVDEYDALPKPTAGIFGKLGSAYDFMNRAAEAWLDV